AFDQLAARRVLAPLLEGVALLVHVEAFLAGERQEAVAGYAGEDGARERRGDDAPIVEHEEHVHPAEFLDPLALGGVEENDLVAAAGDGLGLRDEAGRVVAAALGRPGPAGRRASVVARDPDRDRRDA